MNPPVSETVETPDEEQEFTNNVGEDVPEGFEMEELEDAPFKDTYYDSSVENAEEAPVEEEKEADYNEMQEKFLKKVSFLDRQKLMISKYDLLPSDKRCLRHPDAFPIAVENARNKGVLNDFYADIDKLAK